MDNARLRQILSNFNENQIREINGFLNSDNGRALKKKFGNADKERLLREVEKLDSTQIKQAFSGISKADLERIFGKR